MRFNSTYKSNMALFVLFLSRLIRYIMFAAPYSFYFIY
jgi:hypothetical protein